MSHPVRGELAGIETAAEPLVKCNGNMHVPREDAGRLGMHQQFKRGQR